jgi:hypothetical protein
MNSNKLRAMTGRLLFLLVLSTGACLGDSVNPPVSGFGDPFSPGYLDGLDILPGSFLFTQNTMYDFMGVQELSIVSAFVDPATTWSLAGLPTRIINITFDDPWDSLNGDVPGLLISSALSSSYPISSPVTSNSFVVPEPKTSLLLLIAVCFGGLAVLRARSLRSPREDE